MNKKWLIPIILLLLSLISYVVIQKNNNGDIPVLSEFPQPTTETIPTVYSDSAELTPLTIGEKHFLVEVADTPAKQRQGLSGRDQIGSDGMLFLFPTTSIQSFWMVDMQFDLDFIWINEGKVVEITAHVPKPEPGVLESELPIYRSSVPVSAMLEVTAGFAEQQGIQVGDAVNIN